MRAIDVKPEPTILAELANSLQIIERAGRGSSRCRYDCHDALALAAQAIERLAQQINVDLVIARRDREAALTPNAELTDSACHRVVRMLAINDDWCLLTHAIFPYVG